MFSVMPGLAIISVMAGRDDEALLRADVPAIHVLLAVTKPGTWITGPSPVMTSEFISRQIEGCHAKHEPILDGPRDGYTRRWPRRFTGAPPRLTAKD